MSLSIEEVKQRLRELQHMRDLPPEEFCEEGGLADSLAANFQGSDELKTTQLRKVFQELRAHRAAALRDREGDFDRTRIVTLLPLLAYAQSRNLIPRDFYEVMKLLLDKQRLQTNEDFLRVDAFMTALVAYCKFRKKG